MDIEIIAGKIIAIIYLTCFSIVTVVLVAALKTQLQAKANDFVDYLVYAVLYFGLATSAVVIILCIVCVAT